MLLHGVVSPSVLPLIRQNMQLVAFKNKKTSLCAPKAPTPCSHLQLTLRPFLSLTNVASRIERYVSQQNNDDGPGDRTQNLQLVFFEPETDALPLRQPTTPPEAQQETGNCGCGSTLSASALTTSTLNTSWQAHIGFNFVIQRFGCTLSVDGAEGNCAKTMRLQ